MTDFPDGHNEAWLRGQLERLPHRLRTAFAIACAERLYRAYAPFEGTAVYGEPGELATILDRLWRECETGEPASDWVERSLMRVDDLIPHDDDVPRRPGYEWLNSFAYALAYALDTHRTGDAQVAVWAAMNGYDLLSAIVAGRPGFDPYAPGAKEQIRRDPLVQAEVGRLRLDLEGLLAADDQPGTVRALRARAQRESTSREREG